MNWQILILISLLTYSIAIILQRVLMRGDKSNPIMLAILFQLIAGSIIALYGFLTQDMSLPTDSLVYLPRIMLSTVLWAATNIFVFNALKLIESSEFTILFSTRALFTVIAAAIFLNERLTSQQLMGAALIFIAVIMVTFTRKSLKLSRGEIFTLAGAVCMGLAITNDTYLLQHFNLYPYVTLDYILPALLTAAIYFKSLGQVKPIVRNSKMISNILLMSILYAVSTITFFGAIQISGNASQVTIVNLLSVVVIVMLGMIFLHERDKIWRKLGGALISIAGAVLLIK